MEESKKIKCCKRLKYKQFLQVSGLCGAQCLSYLPKRFTLLVELCMETPYWWTVLVHQYLIWPPEINKKNLEFTFSIKALSFHSRASIRVHKHIF